MSRSRIWRYAAVFLAVNAAFAAMGLVWRHPAGVPGWWVTWIAIDIAVVGAVGMAVAGRPLQPTWDRVFAWVLICVNVGALVSLVVVMVISSHCGPTRVPEGCGVSLLLVLIPIGLVFADFALGAIWGIGRMIRAR